jgi:hypothetical protein
VHISRRRSLALATVAVAATVLLTPSAASAAYYGSETDYGTEVSAPSDSLKPCTSITGARVCFQSDGDYFYVKDTKADGYSAVVDWFDGGSTRRGACVNKHGEGAWARCNKNFVEGHNITFRAARYNSGNPVDSGGWVAEGA